MRVCVCVCVHGFKLVCMYVWTKRMSFYFLSFACVLFWTRRKRKIHIYRKIFSFVFLIAQWFGSHTHQHTYTSTSHWTRATHILWAHVLSHTFSSALLYSNARNVEYCCCWCMVFFSSFFLLLLLLRFCFVSFFFFFFFALNSCLYIAAATAAVAAVAAVVVAAGCCYEIMKCKAAHRPKGKDISTMQTMWKRSERFNSNNSQFKCVASTKYLDH